jgi:DNA repair exonuclease SbcCD ATPase subunit
MWIKQTTMKITLKNFRCYEDSTFDFGENGITLLSGSSGTGKTSILLGIYFALFGTGNKLAMYGKSSCTVTLEFDGMTVTRSKRPNRLVVNSIYEDDAGQSIIDKKFGDSFKTTGYISQNARDSFILMSPIEKLGFLEKFAFQDINLSIIKKRCKDLIKERNDNLLKTTSQLEIATAMLKELSEPEKVEFPLKCSKNNMERVIKNETIRSKNTITMIKKCNKEISSLQNELHSLQVLNAQIISKQEGLSSVIEKLADMSLEESMIEYKGEDKLQEYQDQLSTLISQRDLLMIQERYSDDVIRLQSMKENETLTKNNEIESIENSIWTEYTNDDCKTTIEEYKHTIKDLEKLHDLETDLDRYVVDEEQLSRYIEELVESKSNLDEKKKLLDRLELQQEIFQCPSCQVQLKFQDDDLKVYELDVNTDDESEDIDIVSKDIEKLKRKIISLESSIPIKKTKLERHKEISKSVKNIRDQYEELPSLSDMKNDLEYIRSYKLSQEELYKHLKFLKSNDSYSSTISSFEKSIEKQNIKINKLVEEKTKKYDNDLNEESIRQIIIIQKQNKEKLETFRREIKKLNGSKITFEKDIKFCTDEHINVYKNIKDESTIEGKINLNISELSKLSIKHEEHKKNLENIGKYQEYKTTLDVYNSWNTKISRLVKDEIECRKLYASVTLLKEKILEAESIAMLNVISSINTHTQGYLETFFPDNPISVKLVPFKETKSGKTVTRKPQINLEIEYKGMEADINMLSGGELSRVILSFALALGEMFNTPMMLLDECTSSLDQDLTGVVMEGIRDHFPGKLVLIIAHQVVKGQFDKVIQIGPTE